MNNKEAENSDGISRKQFLGQTAAAAAGIMIVPRHVLGGPGYRAPSDQVNIGLIGAGGRGMSVVSGPINAGHNLVAIADIDFKYVNERAEARRTNNDGSANPDGIKLHEAYENAARYADFRVMLEEERDNLDGVIIATPDHGHAVQANTAMQLGLAVYVEKPLTYTVHEARVLRETARQTGVVTQMGNQGHSYDESKRVIEWIQGGVLGPVREVLVWTNRPTWPQGIPRPVTPNMHNQTPSLSDELLLNQSATIGDTEHSIDWGMRNIQQPLAQAMAGDYSPPPGVDWDLFIGPAQKVPYHPIYHPFNWRGWVDWGVGALGDMGAHLLDQPFSALELNLPSSVMATFTPFGMGTDNLPASWPQATAVHYEFPARGDKPPVKMHWYDGGLYPPYPDLLPPETILSGNGVIYVGDKGILLTGNRGVGPHLFYPESLKDDADRIPETLPRVPDSHTINWVNAIAGNATPSSDFEFAVPLTETMLLGLVACHTGKGRTLLYHGENMLITNIPEANHFLHREYRSGWSI